MNTLMTQQTQSGQKTQTRRVAKKIKDFKKEVNNTVSVWFKDGYFNNYIWDRFFKENAKYQKDEVVWIREPVKVNSYCEELNVMDFQYLSDEKVGTLYELPERIIGKKWAVNQQGIPNGCISEMKRTFVKITGLRLEWLEDISDEDCISEGIKIEEKSGEWYRDYLETYDNFNIKFPKESFASLWDSTTPKEYKWGTKTPVIVYEFERVER